MNLHSKHPLKHKAWPSFSALNILMKKMIKLDVGITNVGSKLCYSSGWPHPCLARRAPPRSCFSFRVKTRRTAPSCELNLPFRSRHLDSDCLWGITRPLPTSQGFQRPLNLGAELKLNLQATTLLTSSISFEPFCRRQSPPCGVVFSCLFCPDVRGPAIR